jgi:hypothetical protein
MIVEASPFILEVVIVGLQIPNILGEVAQRNARDK